MEGRESLKEKAWRGPMNLAALMPPNNILPGLWFGCCSRSGSAS